MNGYKYWHNYNIIGMSVISLHMQPTDSIVIKNDTWLNLCMHSFIHSPLQMLQSRCWIAVWSVTLAHETQRTRTSPLFLTIHLWRTIRKDVQGKVLCIIIDIIITVGYANNCSQDSNYRHYIPMFCHSNALIWAVQISKNTPTDRILLPSSLPKYFQMYLQIHWSWKSNLKRSSMSSLLSTPHK